MSPHSGKVRNALLPREWRGLKNEELSKVTGIPGCVYVHDFGYIGGNRTYEGALTMAKKALAIGRSLSESTVFSRY